MGACLGHVAARTAQKSGVDPVRRGRPQPDTNVSMRFDTDGKVGPPPLRALGNAKIVKPVGGRCPQRGRPEISGRAVGSAMGKKFPWNSRAINSSGVQVRPLRQICFKQMLLAQWSVIVPVSTSCSSSSAWNSGIVGPTRHDSSPGTAQTRHLGNGRARERSLAIRLSRSRAGFYSRIQHYPCHQARLGHDTGVILPGQGRKLGNFSALNRTSIACRDLQVFLV